MPKKSRGRERSFEGEIGGSIGGIFKGLADLVEKLGELAETGQELSRRGEIVGGGPGKPLKGVYGFNVRVGLGDKEVRIEPFGNIRREEKSGQPIVQEMREPVVDVLEEEDCTLVVAEMPGIGPEDIQLDVKDDVLTISAERGEKKYRKEVLLPKSYPREKMLVSCNNGILEIKCTN